MSLDLNFNLRPIDGNKHFTCARILTFHSHERMPPDHPHTCLFPRAIFYTVYSCSQQQQKNAEYLSGIKSSNIIQPTFHKLVLRNNYFTGSQDGLCNSATWGLSHILSAHYQVEEPFLASPLSP